MSLTVAASALFLAAALCAPPQAPTPQSKTPNTIALPAEAGRPKATLDAMRWIAGGVWRGDGLGGATEERWSAPAGGAMMGMFRLIKPGADGREAVAFYEFLTIVEQDDSIVMKLKHFNADLTGWEEKDRFVTFRLARVTPEAVYFDGLTFRRDGPDAMTIFLALRDTKTNTTSEAVFTMRRSRAD